MKTLPGGAFKDTALNSTSNVAVYLNATDIKKTGSHITNQDKTPMQVCRFGSFVVVTVRPVHPLLRLLQWK